MIKLATLATCFAIGIALFIYQPLLLLIGGIISIVLFISSYGERSKRSR